MSRSQRLIESRFAFDKTVEELKNAIANAGLWLIHEIDPQMLLRKGGFEIRPARQLLFFHPRYMVRLLNANEAAIVEAPLKLVVMENEHGTVEVRSPDPAQAFTEYVGTEELGRELADIVAQITLAVERAPCAIANEKSPRGAVRSSPS